MRIEQQNSLNRQCLRISSQDDFAIQDFREKMLLHNRVRGLLTFDVLRQNDERIYEYSVSGLFKLSDRCESTHISHDDLQKMLGSIIDALNMGKEYLLLEDDFVLLPNTVFLNAESEAAVAYYPGYRHNIREQMCSLAEYLLDKIEYTDEAAVLLAYSFYMKTRDDNCRIEDLAELLNNCEKSASNNTEKKELPVSSHKEVAEERIYEQSEPRMVSTGGDKKTVEQTGILQKVIPKAAGIVILAIIVIEAVLFVRGTVSFKSGFIKACLVLAAGGFAALETVRVSRELMLRTQLYTSHATEYIEDEATVLLEQNTVGAEMILASADYSSIAVNRFPFVIGKDKDMSDYVLGATGVSRGHLRLDRTEDITYVTDLNSTNGTCINGIRLKPGEPAVFAKGDRLEVAGCVFYYSYDACHKNCGSV